METVKNQFFLFVCAAGSRVEGAEQLFLAPRQTQSHFFGFCSCKLVSRALCSTAMGVPQDGRDSGRRLQL